jgi:hypothetical protein
MSSDLATTILADRAVVPGFQPSVAGFRFANRFPPGPTVRFGPLDPRWIGIGDAAAGLCGGMAWYVRERFETGQPIATTAEPPANGSPLFRAIVRRQVRSLDRLRTPVRFWWMGAQGDRTALASSRDHAWPWIRERLDAGRLAMVGLMRHRGANPFRLTDSHQVLAFAYEVADDGEVTLRFYDPNHPGRDDVTVTLDATGLRQSTGEPLRGLLSLP